MDPDSVKSTLSNLAFGNVIAAAARDLQKVNRPSTQLPPPPPDEMVAKDKAQAAPASHDEVDLDELLDDPELEKLHAERIAALKKEAEKREVLKRKGHGEYREITEGDFLGEVTSSEKVICHFYHREFYRCKYVIPSLSASSFTYTICLSNAPFFVSKLAIKTLPCVILFKKGIAVDRLIGFQDLGSKDDFSTRALENILKMKGIIDEKKKDDEDEDDESESKNRRVRSSTAQDSDSD
ncbi:hypothetical protein HU200_034581 [Digitaria exilis]|uniref:Thioredoxin domain-containing protein n=1 Tax=Digitaria exilis TaxID=1010633 RepID=A0A835EML1_9POAL|nr:hypothetical protein HU200_034581 [Digitaria exilis]